MIVTRITLDDLIRNAQQQMEHQDGRAPDPSVAQALTHYLTSVPGTWRLVAVVADGEFREFYWAATK